MITVSLATTDDSVLRPGKRPRGGGQETWGDAWQKEMERAQAGSWFGHGVLDGMKDGVAAQARVRPVPLPLPPVPAGIAGFQRDLILEVRQFRESGPQKPLASVPLSGSSAPGKPLWTSVVTIAGTGYRFEATHDGDTIQVTYGGQ